MSWELNQLLCEFLRKWIALSTCPWNLWLTRRACRTPDKQKTSYISFSCRFQCTISDWKEIFFSCFYFQIINSTNIHWCKEVSDRNWMLDVQNPIQYGSCSQESHSLLGREAYSFNTHSYCLSTYFASHYFWCLGCNSRTHLQRYLPRWGLYSLRVVLVKTADLQSGKYISKWWTWLKPRFVFVRGPEAGRLACVIISLTEGCIMTHLHSYMVRQRHWVA